MQTFVLTDIFVTTALIGLMSFAVTLAAFMIAIGAWRDMRALRRGKMNFAFSFILAAWLLYVAFLLASFAYFYWGQPR